MSPVPSTSARQLPFAPKAILFVVGVFVAIPVVCLAYVFAPIANDATVVKLPSQIHDFGAMLTSSKGTYTFRCRNTLWDVLFIDRIGKSCGCTSAHVDRSVILPGGLFSITATLSTPAFNENLSSHITLRGHAGRYRVEDDLELLGAAKSALDFPDAGGGFLRLGSWRLDQLPATTTITVKRGKFPLQFDELRVVCPSGLSSRIQATSSDTWRVPFQISPTEALGTTGYPVTFEFARNGKLLPENVDQQAYVEIFGPIVASPSSLLFAISPGERVRKTITITQRDATGAGVVPEITGVSANSSNMHAAWDNDPNQRVAVLDYTAPTRIGVDRGEIAVCVNEHGTSYRLKVTFLAAIN
jgi:hypothetical protein